MWVIRSYHSCWRLAAALSILFTAAQGRDAAAQDLAGSHISINGEFPANCSPPAASYGMQTNISIAVGNSITLLIADTPRQTTINGPVTSRPYAIRKHTDFVYQGTAQGIETFSASFQGTRLRLQMARRGEGISWTNDYDIDVSGGACRFTYSFSYFNPAEYETQKATSQRCTITQANCVMSGPIARLGQPGAPSARPQGPSARPTTSNACGCFALRQLPRSGSQFPFAGDNRCPVSVTYTVNVCDRDYSTGRGVVTCKPTAFSMGATSSDFTTGYSDGQAAQLLRVCAGGNCCTPQ